MAALTEHVARLEVGAPSWVAILGHRKVGKTSLLLELQRRMATSRLVFALLDTLEFSPLDADIVRRYAIRVADAVLSPELGVSLESRARLPGEYRAALSALPRFAGFAPVLRELLLDLPELQIGPEAARSCLDLPQWLADACDVRLVVAWDEFQALARIRGRWGKALHPLLRSVWQRHERVGYIISGSERGMLRDIVSDANAPFFQHFAIMELDVLPEEDGLRLLTEAAPPDRPIPDEVARVAVDVLGSHPFYLQLFGEELTRHPAPYGEGALKQSLQALLFSRTGRLSLFFENEYRGVVGRSTWPRRSRPVQQRPLATYEG
ncbi:MAG: ATP-binding protein [Deltaproteobacteria bacterium]|nr:ATP-binding protein [Deltaproteobacteria bacterium]